MQPIRTSLAIFLSLYSLSVWAEHGDRDQPMQVEADQVVMNEVEKTSIFTGNVEIRQGTLEIHGDKIAISQDKQGNKISNIYGLPASFKQKRDGLDEYVEGYGEHIVYDANMQILNLYGQARLKREQDFIRGEHINYNSQSEIFIVDNGATTPGKTKQRVRAVLQPRRDPTVTPPTEKK